MAKVIFYNMNNMLWKPIVYLNLERIFPPNFEFRPRPCMHALDLYMSVCPTCSCSVGMSFIMVSSSPLSRIVEEPAELIAQLVTDAAAAAAARDDDDVSAPSPGFIIDWT